MADGIAILRKKYEYKGKTVYLNMITEGEVQ